MRFRIFSLLVYSEPAPDGSFRSHMEEAAPWWKSHSLAARVRARTPPPSFLSKSPERKAIRKVKMTRERASLRL
jgi:hypothetical protein